MKGLGRASACSLDPETPTISGGPGLDGLDSREHSFNVVWTAFSLALGGVGGGGISFLSLWPLCLAVVCSIMALTKASRLSVSWWCSGPVWTACGSRGCCRSGTMWKCSILC